MKKTIIISSSILAAAIAGGIIYQRYFNEPQIEVLSVNKTEKEITFKFSGKKTKLNYAKLAHPVTVKGRMEYSVKVIKRGNVIEFQRKRQGSLAGYPVVVEL